MHHLSLRNYSGCNNACFLISVSAFVHIVCSCYRIGHNGSLVAGRLFEMHQGVAIGLRLLVFETVGKCKYCHFKNYRPLLAEFLSYC